MAFEKESFEMIVEYDNDYEEYSVYVNRINSRTGERTLMHDHCFPDGKHYGWNTAKEQAILWGFGVLERIVRREFK